jgi:hypothetical protein
VNGHDVPTSCEMMEERQDGSAGELMKRHPSGSDGPLADGQGQTECFPAVAVGQDVDLPAVEQSLSGAVENGQPPVPIAGRE